LAKGGKRNIEEIIHFDGDVSEVQVKKGRLVPEEYTKLDLAEASH